MTQPVAVGNDGRSEADAPGDGPLLIALKEYFTAARNDYLAEMRDRRLKMRQASALAQPVYAQVSHAVTVPASGNAIVQLGGPQIGRRWVVRMVTISDGAAFWNSMGSAQAVIATGNVGGVISVLPPNMVRWPVNSLPNSTTFGADQMWIVPSEKVFVALTGGTSGQNVQVTMWFQDFLADSPLSSDQLV